MSSKEPRVFCPIHKWVPAKRANKRYYIVPRNDKPYGVCSNDQCIQADVLREIVAG